MTTTVPMRRLHTGSRRGTRSGRRYPWHVGYLFILPHLVLFAAFIAWPFVLGGWISLHSWDFFRPVQPFVGLANYKDLLDPHGLYGELFWQTLGNTLLFVTISTPILVIAGLGLAVLLNTRIKGRVLFRSVVVFPWTLSVAVTGVLWWNMLNDSSGLLPKLLHHLGVGSPAWLTSLPWAWISILAATVWWTAGFNTIIFLAGLQNVPPQLHEAAQIDGAGTWRRFWHVTLPALRPVLLLVTTLQIISSFNMVGQSQLMTGGGPPPHQTTPVLQYIYEIGFTGRYEIGPAAAMSILLAVVMLIVSVANFRLMRVADR